MIGAVRFWALLLPLLGTLTATSFPVSQSFEKARREKLAAALLEEARAAQEAFRQTGGNGGYATRLESLTTPCPGSGNAWMSSKILSEAAGARFEVRLRAGRDARLDGHDCHGAPAADDYFLTIQPVSAEEPTQQAFARSRDRTGVFFDGLAPAEGDLRPAGLATPVEALAGFKIP